MQYRAVLSVLCCVLSSAASHASNDDSSSQNQSLPVIDLGYNLQRATSYNDTAGYYNFSNIRFAAPPTGENRWHVPQPPAVNRTAIQTGDVGRICPQGSPNWQAITSQFVPVYLKTGRTNWTLSDFNLTASNETVPAEDPRTSEDCLFLDVIVPASIFDNAGSGYGAPVLVWIYGGGYVEGSKGDVGSPAGILKQAEINHNQGVVYVAMNYRLGAFGWLSGPTFQENGTANLGLYDQRYALDWIQTHIAKFGGDPNRVTVFGESAGGGSIMHQITAYGGLKGRAPFQQAVPQSPGWQPLVSNSQQEQIFQQYLKLLNVSSLNEARIISSATLRRANALQIANSAYGQFVYGPAVDGNFVPRQPGELLLHGQFDQSVRVMVGHNADEGLLFTSPFINNQSSLEAALMSLLPDFRSWPNHLDYVVNILYPPIFDGTQAQNYTNQIARAAAIISEAIFTCNTFYLDQAYNRNTYSYFFAVPPATHGLDNPYFFFDGPTSKVQNASLAMKMQDYLTAFAVRGRPNEPGLLTFNEFGANATAQLFNLSLIAQTRDPTANQRCLWWQKALYY